MKRILSRSLLFIAVLLIVRPIFAGAPPVAIPVLTLLDGRVRIECLGWLTSARGYWEPVIAVTMLPNSGQFWNWHLSSVGVDPKPEERLLPEPPPPPFVLPVGPYFAPLATDGSFWARTGAMYLIRAEVLGNRWRWDQTLGTRYSFWYWSYWGGELGFNGAGAPFEGPYRSTTELFTLEMTSCVDRLWISVHLRPPHAATNSVVTGGWLQLPPCEPTPTPTFTPTDTPTPTNTVTLTPTPTVTVIWTPTPTPTWTPTHTPTFTFTPTTETPTPTATPTRTPTPRIPIETNIWKCDGYPGGWSNRVIVSVKNTGSESLTSAVLCVEPSWVRQGQVDPSVWPENDPWTVPGQFQSGTASWLLGDIAPGEVKKAHLRFYTFTTTPKGNHYLFYHLSADQLVPPLEIPVKIVVIRNPS